MHSCSRPHELVLRVTPRSTATKITEDAAIITKAPAPTLLKNIPPGTSTIRLLQVLLPHISTPSRCFDNVTGGTMARRTVRIADATGALTLVLFRDAAEAIDTKNIAAGSAVAISNILSKNMVLTSTSK